MTTRSGKTSVVVILALLLAVPAACTKKALTENDAFHRVELLPEVEIFSEGLRNKGGHPVIRRESSCGKEASIAFSVAESHATHTALWNRFCVNVDDGTIRIFDVEADEYVPLDEWRRQQ
jgi:predicted TIM-barrel enzyme